MATAKQNKAVNSADNTTSGLQKAKMFVSKACRAVINFFHNINIKIYRFVKKLNQPSGDIYSSEYNWHVYLRYVIAAACFLACLTMFFPVVGITVSSSTGDTYLTGFQLMFGGVFTRDDLLYRVIKADAIDGQKFLEARAAVIVLYSFLLVSGVLSVIRFKSKRVEKNKFRIVYLLLLVSAYLFIFLPRMSLSGATTNSNYFLSQIGSIGCVLAILAFIGILFYVDLWIACLTPAMVILGLFMFFPILNTFIMSFMVDFQFKSGAGIFAFAHNNSGIGFAEYAAVLQDPTFITALKNTLLIVVVSVPVTVILGLLISVCLNGIKKVQGIFQTIFFLPYVTNTIALGMVFKVMFSTQGGLVNEIIRLLGGQGVAWLTDSTMETGYWSVFFVILVYTVWNGLAFKILVFLSGLQSIDKQYYDAAKIDGASRARIFSKITVPLLSPMILYVTITSFIGAFKAYTSVIAIFGRGSNVYGPSGDTDMWITVVGYIYNKLGLMMAEGNLAKASAGSVILLVIILVVTLIQGQVSKKRVHY